MTVRIGDTARSALVKARIDLNSEPGDELDVMYNRNQRRFRPSYLVINYHQTPSEPAWRVSSCTVGGPIIKKDGTASTQSGTNEYGGWRGFKLADAPQWLRDLIAANTPGEFRWEDAL